ncbi:MAG: plastocyanin [Cyanobacteria bacterium J06641_5]
MIANIAKKLVVTLSVALLAVASFAFSAAPASAADVEVVMGAGGALKFEPSEVSIAPGDTITFVMDQLAPHNVVFDAKAIPGADKKLAKSLSVAKLLQNTGDTAEVTFPATAKPGVYPFFCQPHRGAGMVGKVIVE